MTAATDGDLFVPLVADGALALAGPRAALALAAAWTPIGRVPSSAPPAGALIRLAAGRAAEPPAGAPVFTLGPVGAWVDGDRAVLVGGGASAALSLGRPGADLRLPDGDDERAAFARRSTLTAAAALLLGRLGRALVHAGAVVHPATGAAWLLVGDSHAGKSTSVANLARAGWGVLADDTVSLASAGDAVTVEGWPRTMHIDAGWAAGRPEGHRIASDAAALLPAPPSAGTWPLAGTLLPAVDAARPTAARAASGADALAQLVRQSPWLLADAAVAPTVLALLHRAALRPAAWLSLGIDSFADPARLAAVVRSVTG